MVLSLDGTDQSALRRRPVHVPQGCDHPDIREAGVRLHDRPPSSRKGMHVRREARLVDDHRYGVELSLAPIPKKSSQKNRPDAPYEGLPPNRWMPRTNAKCPRTPAGRRGNLCPRSRCLIGYASSERSKAILDPQRELIDIHRSRRGCFDISAVSAPSGSSPSGGTQRYPFRAAKRMAHSNAVRLLPSGNAWLLATACNKTAVFVANSGYFSKSPKPALGAANAEPASVSLMTARTVARSVPRCPHRRVHRGNFGVTRLPRRESSRSASGAGSLPGGRTQGVAFFDRVGGGLETMPNALLTPSRRGEHPISERQSIAIRCARWEPQTFGYLLPNWWARAHASGRLRTARENKQPRH